MGSNCPSPPKPNDSKVCCLCVSISSEGITCLIDTGCAKSIMYSLGTLKTKRKNTEVKGIGNSVRLTEVVDELSVYNVRLSEVPLMRENLMIGDVKVDIILGLDFFRKVGGIVMRFDEFGKPTREPITPMFLSVNTASKTRKIMDAFTQTGTDNSQQGNEMIAIESDIPCGYELTARIVLKDMTLRRFRKILNPVEQYWEVEWQWMDNSPPAPSSAPANYGLDNHTPEAQEGFIKECQLWEDQEFIVPVEKSLMKNTIPLMCVEQAHKISTPIRPVGDYKRKLNKHLVSTPNEDHDHPLSANLMIIRWRSLPLELKDAFLVDVSKAYMRIRVNPKQTYYQCFILPWKKHKYYRLTRLGFGVSIAVKVLRVILNYILEEEGIDRGIISPYVDDMICPKKDIERLRGALVKNGFDIKEPEDLDKAKVLGLLIQPTGQWHRRTAFPEIESSHELTRRLIHKWCGRITAHFPVCGWLRPACSALKRLTTIPIDNKSPTWDEPVQPSIVKTVQKFLKEIQERGDSVTGDWSFDKSKEWNLYTDASKHALGCVLKVGNVVVLDNTWLRNLNDARHINIAELDAVIKGIGMVYQTKRALCIDPIQVTVHCDNSSVVAWLNRNEKLDIGEQREARVQRL